MNQRNPSVAIPAGYIRTDRISGRFPPTGGDWRDSLSFDFFQKIHNPLTLTRLGNAAFNHLTPMAINFKSIE